MAFLLPLTESYGVCVGSQIFLVGESDGHEEETVVPLIEESIKEEKSEEKPNDQTVVEVTCCDVNDTRNSIAICTNQKQLIVKSVVFWSTFLQRRIEKQATAVRFVTTSNSQDRHILVADRAGNVYQHSFDPDSPPQLILGHYSIIMDLIFTSNPDLVVTCDRDEKIRISRYPGAFLIERYLLGHTEYVRSLGFVTVGGQKRLVSVSGKSVRVWDYLKDSNKPLCSVSTGVGEIEIVPRKLLISPNLPLACVSYERNSTIKLIEFQSTETEAINATVSDRNLTNQQGENKAELKDFSFNTDGNLVVLLLEMSASFIDVYNFVTGSEGMLEMNQLKSVSLSDSVYNAIKCSNDDLPSLIAKSVGFSNVEDYKRRKQERIEESQRKRLKCC